MKIITLYFMANDNITLLTPDERGYLLRKIDYLNSKSIQFTSSAKLEQNNIEFAKGFFRLTIVEFCGQYFFEVWSKFLTYELISQPLVIDVTD